MAQTFDLSAMPVSPGAVLEAGPGAFARVSRAVPIPAGTRVRVEDADGDGTLHVVRLTREDQDARIRGPWGVPVRFAIPVAERGKWKLVRLVPL